MKRICSNGMCKEYKNGNITIKFDRENYKWSTQFIDLWVSVLTVVETNFSEV